MVAFHDRRPKPRASFEEAVSRLSLNKGETVGKGFVDDRYLVRGIPAENEEGTPTRQYVLHEVLPNGHVIELGETYDTRALAKRSTRSMKPTRITEI